MKVQTHNGCFHTDELFAIAMLRILDPSIEIIRTRVIPEDLTDTILVDVGRIYDPDNLKFDHHQLDGPTRPSGVKYASAGLIFKEYGTILIGKIIKDKTSPHISKIFDDFDKYLIVIDMIDNGQSTNLILGDIITINTLVASYVPIGRVYDQKSEDESFMKILQIIQDFIISTIIRLHFKYEYASYAMAALKKTIKDESQIIIFHEAGPFVQTFTEYLEGVDLKIIPKVVIFPANEIDGNKSWMIRGLPKNSIDWAIILPCPIEWRGKTADEFCQITGVEGSLFAHASGFLVGADTYEHAITLAKKWVNEL